MWTNALRTSRAAAALSLCVATILVSTFAAESPTTQAQGTAPTAEKPNETAQDSAARVEVRGRSDDLSARRAETAARYVVSRREIEKLGETTVLDLLKRLPAVSVTNTGTPALRGLPGYTQLLVDGAPPPLGFRLSNLSPDQLERIEIVRGSVAEHSAQAVAGTINLVLREAGRRSGGSVRLGASRQGGSGSAQGQVTEDGRALPEGTAYTFSGWTTVTRGEARSSDETVFESLSNGSTGTATGNSAGKSDSAMANASGRRQWRLEADESVTVSPMLMLSRSRQDGREIRMRQGLIQGATSENLTSDGWSELLSGDLGLAWEKAIEGGSQWTVRGSVNALKLRSHSQRETNAVGLPSIARSDDSKSHSVGSRGGITWAAAGVAQHRLQAGVDVSSRLTRDGSGRFINGSADLTASEFGSETVSRLSQWSYYLQDDWTPNKIWAINGGLRYEGGNASVTAGVEEAARSYGILAPSLNIRRKFGDRGENVIRLGVARTFRPIGTSQLLSRPEISRQYPCPPGGKCGANAPESPDRLSNPNLRSETALGWDLSFERYGASGQFMSLGLFYRRISDQTRQQLTLASVDWADVPRYVLRPENTGAAHALGVETELRFGLNDLFERAPVVELSISWSWYRSRVSGVSGPDNRLDGQPANSGKISMAWQASTLPLRLQSSLSWRPATRVRLSERQVTLTARQVSWDAAVVWKLGAESSLRFEATNLVPDRRPSTEEFNDAIGRYVTRRWTESRSGWRLRWDQKFP